MRQEGSGGLNGSSQALVADATGLPEWLVELAPAMAFSTGLLVLGFVLVGFGAHGSQEQTIPHPAVPDVEPDETEPRAHD
jgi:hypothetical protein